MARGAGPPLARLRTCASGQVSPKSTFPVGTLPQLNRRCRLHLLTGLACPVSFRRSQRSLTRASYKPRRRSSAVIKAAGITAGHSVVRPQKFAKTLPKPAVFQPLALTCGNRTNNAVTCGNMRLRYGTMRVVCVLYPARGGARRWPVRRPGSVPPGEQTSQRDTHSRPSRPDGRRTGTGAPWIEVT